MCKSIWTYELVCSFCFILGLWAAGRLMLWLVVLSISQWFFVLYSIKNPRLSTTCLHNRYFKVTSFYSSSCSISWNTPPENLHEPAPKLVSQDDIHRKSSVFSGFHLNLQGCTLWYPQHVESIRQLQICGMDQVTVLFKLMDLFPLLSAGVLGCVRWMVTPETSWDYLKQTCLDMFLTRNDAERVHCNDVLVRGFQTTYITNLNDTYSIHRIHVWYIYIYANIWGILMVNVTIYSIHGSYGVYIDMPFHRRHDIKRDQPVPGALQPVPGHARGRQDPDGNSKGGASVDPGHSQVWGIWPATSTSSSSQEDKDQGKAHHEDP